MFYDGACGRSRGWFPLFVCLFSSRFTSLTPEGYVDCKVTKETGRRPCAQATTKEILLPQRALCADLGVWVPLTKEREEKRKMMVSTTNSPGSALPPPPPPPTQSIHPSFRHTPDPHLSLLPHIVPRRTTPETSAVGPPTWGPKEASVFP